MHQKFTTYDGRGAILITIAAMLRSADWRVADNGLLHPMEIAIAADGVQSMANVGRGKSGGDMSAFMKLVSAEIAAKLPAAQMELALKDMAFRYSRDFKMNRAPGYWENIERNAQYETRLEMQAITFLHRFARIARAALPEPCICCGGFGWISEFEDGMHYQAACRACKGE